MSGGGSAGPVEAALALAPESDFELLTLELELELSLLLWLWLALELELEALPPSAFAVTLPAFETLAPPPCWETLMPATF